MILIAPSILAANFAYLAQDIISLEEAGADWLHIDIMDGSFVPNISIGPQVVADIRKISRLYFDVHLMIKKPENMISAFVEAGADLITIHAESTVHLHRLIYQIKDYGVKAGIALNPATPVATVENVLSDVDLILAMSVNPGYGGQKFIPAILNKVRQLKYMLDGVESSAHLQIDGGINLKTGQEAVDAGCNIFVSGSFIFKSENIKETIHQFKSMQTRPNF